MKIVFLIIAALFLTAHYLQAQESIEIRLARVEEGQKNLEKRFEDLRTDMNKRFDDMNNRFDDIKNFMYWGFGIIFGWVAILMGFILWDRRTTLAPVAKQTRDLYANQEKILTALREHAKHDEKLMEFMKHAGLW